MSRDRPARSGGAIQDGGELVAGKKHVVPGDLVHDLPDWNVVGNEEREGRLPGQGEGSGGEQSAKAHVGKEKAAALLRRAASIRCSFGGSYWDRTSGPCRVKAVLYR